jgi:hypothetical protein
VAVSVGVFMEAAFTVGSPEAVGAAEAGAEAALARLSPAD